MKLSQYQIDALKSMFTLEFSAKLVKETDPELIEAMIREVIEKTLKDILN